MRECLRLSVAMATILGLPLAATAGPIEWSYTVKTDTINGAPWLYLGTVGYWFWSPETGDYYESNRFYQTSGESEISGSLSGSIRSPDSSDAIVVAGVGYPSHRVNADKPVDRASDPAIRIAFMITDAASGESGQAAFEVEPYVMDGVYSSGTGVTGWSGGPQTQSLVLGGNEYKIIVQEQVRESWSPLLATVEVAAVPEPSTLVLVLGGVAGFGWLRRRAS